ncbi:unnamed protein product, partial [Sphacelaria rigidula]
MWSYKYTSAKSLFADQCRVGVRFEAAAPAARLVDIFSAASQEQRCKCYFFDAGTEKFVGGLFKALLARPDRDRKGFFIGLAFPPDFPFHRSAQATAQRVSAFVSAVGIGSLDMLVVPWPVPVQAGGCRGSSEAERGQRHRDGLLFLKTWKALQKLVDAGEVRALG